MWTYLVRENPMVFETKRMWRRFYRIGTRDRAQRVIALFLLCFIVLILSGTLWVNVGAVPPIVLIQAQTVILLFCIPATSFGAFAGERDRRSWDLLRVAPIEKSQIVAGKFFATLGVIGVVALFFAPFIAFTMVFYKDGRIGPEFLAEFVSLTFGVVLAALTLAISARSKRGFTALATLIGVLVVGLGFIPLFLLVLGPYLYDAAMVTNPFHLLNELSFAATGFTASFVADNPNPVPATSPLVVLPAVMGVAYLVISVLLLYGTKSLLESEDGDGNFSSRSQHA